MKKKNLLLFIFTLLLIIPVNISAKTNYKIGDDIIVSDNYKSSIFMAAQDIETKKESYVEGISLLFGAKSNLDGESDYLVNISEELRFNGVVNNDTFVLASKIKIGGELKRDLYAFGDSVYLTGNIKGNVKIYANSITLEDVIIKKNVTVNASKIIIGENVTIDGKLNYNDTSSITGIENASIKEITKYEASKYEKTLGNKILTQVKSILSFLLVGLLLMYMYPKIFKKLDNEQLELSNAGIGALTLLLAPFLIMLLIVTPFGMGIGFISLTIYIIFAYLSQIVIGYLLGKYVNEKLMKNQPNMYLSLIIGIVLIKVISIFTILGLLIGLFAVAYGMGFLVRTFFDKKEK